MLVLSRQRGETVMIGDDIEVTIIDMRGDKVRLGINAPKSVAVHRKEVFEAIREQNRAAAQMRPQDLPKNLPRPEPAGVPGAARRPHLSHLFTSWKDPSSGVESYLLATRVAPVQQSFPIGSVAFSSDGQFLWFYCAFPPGGRAEYGRTLGLIDLGAGDVRYFPETQFAASSPVIDAKSGIVYWSSGSEIYRRGPGAKDTTVLVARLHSAEPAPPAASASRLTFSADRSSISITEHTGGNFYVGALRLTGQAIQPWHTFDREIRSALFSPTDAGLILVEHAPDRAQAGKRAPKPEASLWLARGGEKPDPLVAEASSAPRGNAWWAADGQHVYCVQRQVGVERIDLETRKPQVVWPGPRGHAHADASGRVFVGDLGAPDAAAERVTFFNAETGKSINLVSEMPPTAFPRSQYNLWPQPQFCMEGQYVLYTTTVLGRADVALTPVDALIRATE